MPSRLRSKSQRFLLMFFVAACVMMHSACISQRGHSQDSDSLSASSLRAAALKALQEGNSELAIASADAMVRQHNTDSRATRLAADIYLRSGKPEWSARIFNRYAKAFPEQMPELWQRGIALYLIGQYEDAAKQFEAHRTVNPHDVENAAWHFLCVAKAKSFEEARKLILPAPNDARVPMAEIHELLSTGNTEGVNQRVNETKVGTRERAEAAFYGDFYLGLYADAAGESVKASELLQRAAKDAPRHYMGDIARVYAAHLKEGIGQDGTKK
ncbi:lipoprotein NlpI [Novipirellula galeiformis]|uniref:Lipoprotein NlpI n=1 Tax=Novipirellula galeiformis TaxID=2528004 RepID=A0A5C6CRM2_9BACT|nr:tetratricopeptide repeat protein [Novipirellula galeiformis]TWU26204.1 lipoprotein NlpI [Novipirellula galeiformis]